MLQTIWLLVLVPLSLYFLSTYIKPLEGEREPRKLAAGILGLAYAGLSLHAAYSVIFAGLPHSDVLFRVSHGVVGGMLVTALASMGYRNAARTMLILAGVLFVAWPLLFGLLLFRIGHAVTLHSIVSARSFYSSEALPVGIAISAIVLLWRRGRNDKKDIDHAGEPAPTEHIAENGTEA
jgi:hypothetical protein